MFKLPTGVGCTTSRGTSLSPRNDADPVAEPAESRVVGEDVTAAVRLLDNKGGVSGQR